MHYEITTIHTLNMLLFLSKSSLISNTVSTQYSHQPQILSQSFQSLSLSVFTFWLRSNSIRYYLFSNIIQMRKQNQQYSRSPNEERYYKPNSPRGNQPKNYESYRMREEFKRDREQNYDRKHNSPDVLKIRNSGTDPKMAYNNQKRSKNLNENEERQPQQPQKRQQTNQDSNRNGSHITQKERYNEKQNAARSKELSKNSSIPNLNYDDKKSYDEQNQDYLKLHQKLNTIEEKISNMKKKVQIKREEKRKIIEARKQKEEEKQQQKKLSLERQMKARKKQQKKVDLKQFVTQVPEHKELHNFENNPYEPKHNIYYISQIIKSYKDDKSLGKEHLLTSLHILKILENSKFATDEEMQARMVFLQRRQGNQNKKSIIFDLDQTLIHCNDTLTPPYDIKLPITFPTGQIIEAGINIRPYAQEILRNLSKKFEVIVFTASHSCYANVVLDYLDPQNQYISHRLFREHCYQTPEGMYCKDLRVMNRNLSDIVLVDNAAYSYASQLDNGIPILPYYHGKSDFELKALQNYLEGMIGLKDVRQLNRKTFQLHLYKKYYEKPMRLVQQLYISEQSQNGGN